MVVTIEGQIQTLRHALYTERSAILQVYNKAKKKNPTVTPVRETIGSSGIVLLIMGLSILGYYIQVPGQ